MANGTRSFDLTVHDGGLRTMGGATMRKNEHTCRWRVEFINLAYDGGGSQSWTQYYWTWIGAQFSKFRNLYISSWGGEAKLTKVEES